MKMRRWLANFWVLAIAVVLLLPMQVYATEQKSSGVTTLTTTVPDTHTVLLDIGEHGSIIINGTAYNHKHKSIEIARLEEQTYFIQPEESWKIEKVCYGKKDNQETVTLADNSFTAPAVNSDDNILTVRFEKGSTGSGNAVNRPDNHRDTGVQTGDFSNITFYVMLLLLSLLFVTGLLHDKQKNR